MFMLKSEPNREMKILLRGVKKNLGQVPPHFELFATINPTRFKMFLEEITYLSQHPSINPDFFILLRYTIATQNLFTYCIGFNKALLLSKGYTLEEFSQLEGSKKILPLDVRHQALFDTVMLALNEPDDFTIDTISHLKDLGWNDADVFDAIDHGAFLFRFSRILKAYSKS